MMNAIMFLINSVLSVIKAVITLIESGNIEEALSKLKDLENSLEVLKEE